MKDLPRFTVEETPQHILLHTKTMEMAWSRSHGALVILRFPGEINLVGHGESSGGVDVALGSRNDWLSQRSFARYLSYRATHTPTNITLTMKIGLGPLLLYDIFLIEENVIRRRVVIENVSTDALHICGIRLIVPNARIGPSATCRFEAPGNSVRPHVPLDVAASQHYDILPRRFFAPGLRTGSAFDPAPSHAVGLLALHGQRDALSSDEIALLCWYHSEQATAQPYIEGNRPGPETEQPAVSLVHEITNTHWLPSDDQMTVGEQYLLLKDGPWTHAAISYRDFMRATLRASYETPTWLRDASIYQTHPALHGGFAGLEADLPNLIALGFTTLVLLPIWEWAVGAPLWDGSWSGTANPYTIRDFQRLDPASGTANQFRDLVERAHELGLYVIVDLPLQGSPSEARYVEENPDWFMRDEHGTFITITQTVMGQRSNELNATSLVYSFDWSNHDFQRFFTTWALDQAQAYNLDGFRAFIPWGIAYNWSRRQSENASVAQLELLAILRQLRSDLRQHIPHSVMLSNLSGPLAAAHNDACYDYPVHHMFVHMALGRINPIELGSYLRDHQTTWPLLNDALAAPRICFTENHDTCYVNSIADSMRGSRASRMILMGMIICGYIPAIWFGQEHGEELVLRELLRVWHTQPVLRHGITLYNAVLCDTPQIFAVARVYTDAHGTQGVIGLINVSPHRRTVTLGLAVERLGLADGSYHLREITSGVIWSERGRHLWRRDDLRQFQLTLNPFGAYCVAIEPAFNEPLFHTAALSFQPIAEEVSVADSSLLNKGAV